MKTFETVSKPPRTIKAPLSQKKNAVFFCFARAAIFQMFWFLQFQI